MTLVHETNGGGRAIHAIVIGVGVYPHLLGGDEETTESHEGMGQLTSPPVSARALATWLIDELNHPDFPTKTVELLLSEDLPSPFVDGFTGKAHAVDEATFKNCRDAIRTWKARGDKNVDDRLLFFFCGHGMSLGAGSMVILPSDFGKDPDDAFETALDFIHLYDAMEQAAAAQQCYFIDACRSRNAKLPRNSGRQILQAGPREADGVRVGPIYYATLLGEDAHARYNQPSIFTEALLSCLSDFGAGDEEGDHDWRVGTFSLARALDHLMSELRKQGAELVQTPIGAEIHSDFYLHHLRDSPKANLYVSTSPPARLNTLLGLSYRCGRFSLEQYFSPDGRTECTLLVPSGDVTVAAYDDDRREYLSQTTHVRPIFKRMRLA